MIATVAQIKARLCAMALLLPSPTVIRSAYANRPRALQPPQLPALVIETGSAGYNFTDESETVVRTARQYLLTLYVQQLTQGREGEAEAAVDAYADAFRDYMAARDGLQLDTAAPPRGLAGVRARLIDDTGFIALYYPINQQAVAYAAVGFTLSVETFHAVVYRGG
jgi:hypothetical protein